MKCAVQGCERKSAGYFMGFLHKGVKQFGYICGTHDKAFGRQNLMSAGMTFSEAIRFEKRSRK